MTLQDCNIQIEYNSLKDNIIQDFYVNLLQVSNEYKRAVGYFSSTALIEISHGICSLVKNNGSIKIIASPNLSEEDLAAINKGYSDRNKIIENALLRELNLTPTNYFAQERLNLLANLIADNVLNIKIAVLKSNNTGIYHEKMGIISDAHNNMVAFSGSMNETSSGLSFNYETIDVFCSWKEAEKIRVENKDSSFNKIWNNLDSEVEIIDIPKINEAIISKFKTKEMNLEIDNEEFKDNKPVKEEEKTYKDKNMPSIPEDITLHEYQIEAINNWVQNNYVGIFDMATGTGKTITALGAITKIAHDKLNDLAIIICVPFQHLVEQWVEDLNKFNIYPIIAYSSSPQKNWKNTLPAKVRIHNRKDKSLFILICTNATFSSDLIQKEIKNLKKEILIVIDEAHNAGAKSFMKLLDNKYKYRLALSATLERYRDEIGTNFLLDYFQYKCIEYPLEKAISEDKLTKYKYIPIIVYLTNDELETYDILTREIGKNIYIDKDGQTKYNEKAEILLVKRARLIAGAKNKLNALKDAISPYKNDDNILVYCGATSIQLNQEDNLEEDESEIRQINAVTSILGHELNMRVAKYTSLENMERRKVIKDSFIKKEIQAIVAIKCLDEGVNIPGIKTAFILASSTNPKEYIQRRGRVLRKFPGKEIATIYDFITLPFSPQEIKTVAYGSLSNYHALIRNEINRIEEFSNSAINKNSELNQIICNIKEAYNFYEDKSKK